MYIFINEELVKLGKASISLEGEAFLYGYGVFETIKFQDRKIHFLKEHMTRLKDGCKKLKLQISIDMRLFKKNCHELMELNNLTSGVLKISCIKEKNGSKVILSLRENKYKAEDYENGFKLCFAHRKRNPYSVLTYIKSNNYIENLLIRREALAGGYDEAICTNVYDKVCEGTISNIFFVRDGIIYTPSVESGILSGIMRQKIIDIVDNINLSIKIGEYTKEDLLMADEIFITNSLMEIMPVSQIDVKPLNLQNNIITKRLRKEYGKYIDTL